MESQQFDQPACHILELSFNFRNAWNIVSFTQTAFVEL